MRIVPISETGWRGPAKPAVVGLPVDWSPGELADGKYVEIALLQGGSETIHELLPTQVLIQGVTLRVTLHGRPQ